MTVRNYLTHKIRLNKKNENQESIEKNVETLKAFVNTVKQQYPDILCKLRKEMHTLIKEEGIKDDSDDNAAYNKTLQPLNANELYQYNKDMLNDSKLTKSEKEMLTTNDDDDDGLNTSTEMIEQEISESLEFSTVTEVLKKFKRKKTTESLLNFEDSSRKFNKKGQQFGSQRKYIHKFRNISCPVDSKENKVKLKLDHHQKSRRPINSSKKTKELDKWQKRKNIKKNENLHKRKLKFPTKAADQQKFKHHQRYESNYNSETEENNKHWSNVIGTHQYQTGKNQANRNYIQTD